MPRALMRRTPTQTPFTTPFETPLAFMLSRAFNDPFFTSENALATNDEGTLAVDVSEDDTDVIVRASLPGFAKDDIHAEVHEGVVTIKAEKTEQFEETGEKFFRKERREQSVSRRLALPSMVDEDMTRAELADGVLTLRLHKIGTASPRRIEIN